MDKKIIWLVALALMMPSIMAISFFCGDGICDDYPGYNESSPENYCGTDCGAYVCPVCSPSTYGCPPTPSCENLGYIRPSACETDSGNAFSGISASICPIFPWICLYWWVLVIIIIILIILLIVWKRKKKKGRK
jgi:hypothetical protein